MSWLKIDDGLFLHPKWLKTPAASRALWITALSYCGKMNTDGIVDGALLPLLGGTDGDAAALVESGLWDRTESGYAFHDFSEYNRTTEQQEAISNARSDAGKAGAKSRWGKHSDSKAIANDGKSIANESQKMPPEPEPVPVPVYAAKAAATREETTASEGAGIAPVGYFDSSKPLPVSVENFLTHSPNPALWRKKLLLELEGRELHSAERYALSLLRKWKEQGLPQTPPPRGEKPRPMTTEEARAAVRADLAHVMAHGDGF